MFKSLFLLAICIFASAAGAQTAAPGPDLSGYGVRIEPDKRVMIVLATLEAARTTNESGEEVPVINTRLSPEGARYRDLLKSDLAALPADLRQKISNFLVAHKRRNANLSEAELVAPFISMAYALTPAPELADPIVTTDLPGNLLDVLDFAPLVREFYRRSSFSGNLGEYIKTYQKTADGRLRTSAREMVSDILSYLNTRPKLTVIERVKTETQKSKSKKTTLKNVELRERDRSFSIVPELLAPVGTVNFVNIKDDYYAVVPAELPAERDLSSSEVRRGFLQFVVDPLIYSNNKDIEIVRPAIKKVLDERRAVDPSTSPDIYLTLTRSLVAAIDAREAEFVRTRAATALARQQINNLKTDAEKRAVASDLERRKTLFSDETALRLSEDYEKGAVLAFYFAEQLKGFEDSGFDIASSLKEMLASFDGTRETDRLGQFAEARKRAAAAREERRKAPVADTTAVNPLVTRLVEVQRLIDARNYAQANTELKGLAAQNPNELRIHYTMGRVASLSAEQAADAETQKRHLLDAKSAYETVVKLHLNRAGELENLQKTAPGSAATVELAKQYFADRPVVSRSYVALGKIHEFYDESIYALKIYEEAIKLGNVPDGAFNEAMTAKARLIKEQ